ncbi:phospholipase D/nuclease [Thozetella sp. PMI_491]|nr:phospholipase D/nuclease [Thozetella sp. PMI_491]
MVDRSSFVHDFIRRLQERQARRWGRTIERAELPEYDVGRPDAAGADGVDASSPGGHGADLDLIVSRSTPVSFRVGTGASIFTQALIPAMLAARAEIIFVTCYWAPSKTLDAISAALVDLADRRRRANEDRNKRSEAALPRLRVRICLSSVSLLQKLLHTSSPDGYIYPPAAWPTKLGLPEATLLEAGGIDMQVKSLFFLPFSIMHPKFVIIDRERAFLPSCNVSWEAWLEACVELSGDAMTGLVAFYARTWEKSLDFCQPLALGEGIGDLKDILPQVVTSSAQSLVSLEPSAPPVPTLVLPSSHHRNPAFRPFPWQRYADPPDTPLNVAVLQLLGDAQRSIYMQTPNFTTLAVIPPLLAALERGVDVEIVTGRSMMILEQLLTAGTTTARCLQALISGQSSLAKSRKSAVDENDGLRQLEAQPPRLGSLRIFYFQVRQQQASAAPSGPGIRADMTEEDPVQSHVKLTVVDERYTVLGSGNMDRASWYTSQELGVLLDDSSFARQVKDSVSTALRGRLQTAFDATEA